MPTATNIIGEKGGGKTLFVVFNANNWNIDFPRFPIIENIGIHLPNCHFSMDILRTIASLIVIENKKPVALMVDEAAQAGMESRDSWGTLAVLRSREIALSRKIKSEFFLVTQMISMIDKRAQWLSDFDMLCEAHYESQASFDLRIPDWFEYTVYNPNRVKTAEWNLFGADVVDAGLFNLYDTDSIPNRALLEMEFVQGFQLQKDDIQETCEFMGYDDDFKMHALKKYDKVVSFLTAEEEDLAQRLGPWFEYLQFSRMENVIIVKLNPRLDKQGRENSWTRAQWGIFNEELKKEDYRYIGKQDAGDLGPHWEKQYEKDKKDDKVRLLE